MGSGFDDLGEEFSENELLGEVLRADDDAVGVIGARRCGQEKSER